MNVFAAIAKRDREHLLKVERPNGYTRSDLKGRAAALASSMTPLHAIKPVLTGRYLVKGWLDPNKTSVIYGESNVGKTFVALDPSLDVAACLPWHGHPVAVQDDGNKWDGPVLYIAAEGGNGLSNRIEATRKNRPSLIERAGRGGEFVLLPTALDLHGPNGWRSTCRRDSRVRLPGRADRDRHPRPHDGNENAAKDMASSFATSTSCASAPERTSWLCITAERTRPKAHAAVGACGLPPKPRSS